MERLADGVIDTQWVSATLGLEELQYAGVQNESP